METKGSLLCLQLPATDSNLQPNKIKNPVHLCLGLATSPVPSGFLTKMFYQEQMKRNSDGFSSENW
jgi:hypothetical protein